MTATGTRSQLLIPAGRPLVPGKMYLRLYDARIDPGRPMDEERFRGPTFGPLFCYIHTYCCAFRIHSECGRHELWLETQDDMIQWESRLYTDIKVFLAGDTDRG